nr:hypothetical protein [Tanacetum cinerariifolium]
NSYVYNPNLNSFDCPPDSYHPPYPTYETYSYDSYRNDSQFGYDCQPQFPLNYESEPGYIENYNSYPYDSSSLPQQYPCCTRCGGPHETCQCDQLIFDEPYCKHCGGPPPHELSIQEMEDPKKQYLDEMKRLSNFEYRDEIKIVELIEIFNAFYYDHVKEISSGSPTTYSDSSLYASFIFDLSINPVPPADRSDFYEFTDKLIPFISPPEYDCFLLKVEPNSKYFTKDVVEDISLTKEPKVHNALPTHPTLQLNMKFHPFSESLFTYVVWIFLPFLVYSVAPHYLLSLRNEDTIFDPGICNYHSF